MSLVLKGQEFIATEALSARLLASLASLAAQRPLVLNGIKMCAQDLRRLADEATQSKHPIWPEGRASCAACCLSEG